MGNRRRVVVTGMGAITPVGLNLESTWSAIVEGKSGAGRITHFDPTDFKSQIAAEVKGFDPEQHFERKDVRRYDRFTQFALVVVREAMADAGLSIDADSELATRSGAVIGVGIGGLQTFSDEMQILHERGPNRVSPLGIPKIIPNMPSGLVSIDQNLLGPVSCSVTACAASANAIGDAAEIIRRGAADMMVAGGTEAAVTEYGVAAFSAAKALTTRNEDPETASRPFDAERDGFLMGEGAGALILEEYEHAKARGARIYAEFVGYGLSADAYHITMPRPGGEGQARAIRAALADAEMDATEIGYVNAHGTSTPANDSTETAAIKIAFGEDVARRVPVSSTKSMTGHLLGGTGAVEAILSVKAMEESVYPPTINYSNPDPECDLDYVPNEARQGKFDSFMSNSFGFGGHNVALIFKRV